MVLCFLNILVRLSCGQVPRLTSDNMTCVSIVHDILTLIQPIGSGRPEQGSKPEPPDKKLCDLLTELTPSPLKCHCNLPSHTDQTNQAPDRPRIGLVRWNPRLTPGCLCRDLNPRPFVFHLMPCHCRI